MTTSGGSMLSAPTVSDTITNNSVTLDWTDVTAASGYRVYRNSTPVATVPSPGYSETEKSAGSYSFYVTALDSSGQESAPSKTVSITCASSGRGRTKALSCS